MYCKTVGMWINVGVEGRVLFCYFFLAVVKGPFVRGGNHKVEPIKEIKRLTRKDRELGGGCLLCTVGR